MSFTVADFADAVIRHEYGAFSPDASVHGSPQFGWDREGRLHHGGLGMGRHLDAWDRPWEHEPWHAHPDFHPEPPPQPAGFGHERGWREQHYAGRGFFPAGFREGHFTPPGYCMAPWECEDDAVIGCDPDSLVRHPRYVPFFAGNDDLSQYDPLRDFSGQMLSTTPAPVHPHPTSGSTAHGDRLSGSMGGIRC